MNVDIRDNSPRALRLMLRAIDEGVRDAARVASELATDSMPGAGAMTTVTKTGRRVYQPSTRGNPPGERTGLLKGSMGFERIRLGQWRYGASARYALYNELGGRPFLFPVVRKKANRLEAAFARTAAARMQRRTGAR